MRATLVLLGEHAPEVRVVAVGHRIVHGGVEFDHPVAIDDAVLARLAALEPLAPLHQPHNLEGVRAARHAFPDVPQVACFDTAFHRAQPELNQRFALPRALHDEGVRRYGFHGISYESICAQLAARGLLAGRVVAAHLGHGASICAIRDGRSVATTMSFSPLDGLPMGTRCGRLDAAVVLHLLQQRAMAPERIARLLYRESGLLGLSGITGEMRELVASPEPAAREAVDYYVEHACRELAGDVRGAGRDRPPRLHGRHRPERRGGPGAHRRSPGLDGARARCRRERRRRGDRLRAGQRRRDPRPRHRRGSGDRAPGGALRQRVVSVAGARSQVPSDSAVAWALAMQSPTETPPR